MDDGFSTFGEDIWVVLVYQAEQDWPLIDVADEGVLVRPEETSLGDFR